MRVGCHRNGRRVPPDAWSRRPQLPQHRGHILRARCAPTKVRTWKTRTRDKERSEINMLVGTFVPLLHPRMTRPTYQTAQYNSTDQVQKGGEVRTHAHTAGRQHVDMGDPVSFPSSVQNEQEGEVESQWCQNVKTAAFTPRWGGSHDVNDQMHTSQPGKRHVLKDDLSHVVQIPFKSSPRATIRRARGRPTRGGGVSMRYRQRESSTNVQCPHTNYKHRNMWSSWQRAQRASYDCPGTA